MQQSALETTVPTDRRAAVDQATPQPPEELAIRPETTEGQEAVATAVEAEAALALLALVRQLAEVATAARELTDTREAAEAVDA